ncbi:MAG: hypothetical protein AAFX97_06020, partial [Pseudomonadota bacterium]
LRYNLLEALALSEAQIDFSDEEIPDGLFTAVAQVLAFVFQLKQYRKRGGQRPKIQDYDLPIPPEHRH